jgi:2-phospho-L-lactate guanylyltransferase (CobY/MobA/RfbA family)
MGRLAGHLTDADRADLGRALAERTAILSVEAGFLPLFIAGDSEVAEWALLQGFPSLPDNGHGLDDAADSGTYWADETGSHWIVIHSDLPLLSVSDLTALETSLLEHGKVLAPSADGGTSALGSRGVNHWFRYGPGSFRRHLALYPKAGIVVRLGLLHDVDTYSDLVSARDHPRGEWLAGVL